MTGPLKHFAAAGADREFVWGETRIDGDLVLVRGAEIANPVSVRYAWAANPVGCNLCKGAGLPVAPFQTDIAR